MLEGVVTVLVRLIGPEGVDLPHQELVVGGVRELEVGEVLGRVHRDHFTLFSSEANQISDPPITTSSH
jgi:hypothetical protein